MQPRRHEALVTTPHLDAVRAFYTEKLGFRVTFEGYGHLALRAPGGEAGISFMLPPDPEQRPYPGHALTWCLEVEDADAVHQEIQQLGLPLARPLQDNPWGDRSFVILDPAGVSLYVYHQIAPTPEFEACFES